MTLASTISGANLTKIRSGSYQAQQFVATVPSSIVVQFQPSVAPTDSVYAKITVGTVASGSMSNVKSYQTVVYSTTTDYKATELYRDYVRKVSGTSTLYIGQTGQNLTTSIYVTVLNQYDIFEKPRVQRGSIQYADWDITFRRLLPVETALPTAVVLIDGTTAWTPTAVPAEIDNDATSTFTHAWESSNGSDSLDSGGTTASPSWTLQANSHRWIRYTFTDSNGNANLRVISVWTVPANLSSVVTLGFIGQDSNVADIQYQTNLGWSCTVPAVSGISSLNKGTLCCVFSIEDYNATRGSIESNIDFVGFLGNEITTTRGDAQYGIVSETRFVINGLGAKLATLSVPIVSPTHTASPSSWDDMENPTPLRAITYLLSEHTTVLHLCAINFPSNHTDFIAHGDLLVCELDTAFEAVQYQSDAMSAILQYAHDGRLDITQNLVEDDDTARNAADTVVAMTPSDWLDYSIERNPDPQVRFLTTYAGVYNTTSEQYAVFRANVPPVADIRGYDEPERVNLVLTTDLSDANAKVEMAQRSANLYAALNPTDILRMTLIDPWRFLQPDVGAWYTFTVALTDTIRGISYDSSTRWQLIDIRYTSNNETGRKEVQATFRKETSDTGANIEVVKLETDPSNNINALPGVLPPFSGGNLDFTDNNWFDSFDASVPTQPTPTSASCEQLGFRPKDAIGATTQQAALLGENIGVLVSGSGIIQDGLVDVDDFTVNNQGWSAYAIGESPFTGLTVATNPTGSYSGGTGWVHTDFTLNPGGSKHRAVVLKFDLGTEKTITYFKMTYSVTKGTANTPNDDALALRGQKEDLVPIQFAEIDFGNLVDGAGQTVTYSDSVGMKSRYLHAQLFATIFGAAYSGSATISKIEVTTKEQYGDAFYYWSDETDVSPFETGDGLLVNSSSPTSIPAYNESHQYEFNELNLSSGPVVFSYNSPLPIGDMENWSQQLTVCFLGT